MTVKSNQYQGLREVFIFLVVAFLYILFNRHGFIVSPDREFSWRVLSAGDPQLFQGDILTTLSNRIYYSFLAWPLAFLNRWFSLQGIFFTGHFITTFFYLYFVYRIGKTLFRDARIAFLVSLGVFVIKPVLVDASLYPTGFHHRNVAWVLQLLAIDLFLRRRLLSVAVAMGVAFLITPYAVAHLASMMAFALLFQWKTYEFRTLLKAVVIFFILITPMLAWRVRASGLSLVSAGDEWWQFVRTYVPSYFFPSLLWRPENGGLNNFLMAFVWPFYFLASYAKRYVKPEHVHRTILLLMGGLLVLLFMGYFFAEVIHFIFIAQLMIFRAHRFFVLFSIIYFSYYLVMRFREEEALLPKLLIVVMAAAFLSSKMILCTSLLAADFCLQFFKNKRLKNLLTGAGLIALSAILIVPEARQPHIVNRLFHLNLPFGAFWLATFWFYQQSFAGKETNGGADRISFRWLVYTALFTFLLFPSYWGVGKQFIKHPLKTTLDQVQWPWQLPYDAEHQSLFQWVRTETPPDAVFLIPLMDDGLNRYFKTETKRGEVVNTGNSMAVISLDFARKWKELYTAFEPFVEPPVEEKVLQMTTKQIRQFYGRYPFDYYVTLRQAKPLDYPLAFQNERFIVYRIDA